ncbi:hypothetical protein BCR43DRAFT_481325 [Syncephalastrum racemosum]|uniref:SMAD/FHA domain-containing protein n=1 Tax=Syncephalastrum racemosum TaxID=13706 RepID=A0A1X2HRU0_SYNRA|nr:hypothetical protein BCR43DRAFT_481325 [Syncephalastrum racemosum]
MPNRLSFKSKVVSRSHAEIWVQPETNKIYVRDVGSSSGTFVNRARLSPANLQSAPQEVKDGDVIQLGVDYQGGIEPMYRAVRMRLEVNRDTHVSHLFNRAAFTQLRHHLLATVAPNLNTGSDTSDFSEEDENPKSSPHASSLPENVKVRETSTKTTARNSPSAPVQHAEIQECCICLYAIAPLQALFIAPCSHIFHFKCLRPLLFQNYPGFCCPICRTYNDLEASVALEVSDVMESLGIKTSEDEEEEKVEGRQEAAPATAASGAAGPGAGAEAEAAPAGIAKRGEPQQPAIREEEEPSSHPASRRASRHLPLPNTTENLLSTTLVASPPTFEEMMTASSGSPT